MEITAQLLLLLLVALELQGVASAQATAVAPVITMVQPESPTSIIVEWTREGEVDSFEIAYDRVTGATQQGPCPSVEDSGTVTVSDGTARQQTVSGLEEFSTYSFTITAMADGVTSPPSGSMTATTEQAAPGPPESVRAVNVTSTSITVAWDPVKCIDRNSEIAHYEVRYHAESISTSRGNMIVPGSGDVGGMSTISQLTPFTSYSIRVVANSRAFQLGVFSNAIVVETLQDGTEATTAPPTSGTEAPSPPTSVPLPTVSISPTDGTAIAGQPHSLTCSVILGEGASGDPVVEWRGPGGSQLDGESDIMVGSVSIVDSSTFTSTLDFTNLRTSHGGGYTCQATADSPMGPGTASTSVIVQIPAPSVAISRDRSDNPLYAGTPLTLTCMAMVDTAVVDTAVTMEATWSGPGIGGSRVTASDFTLQFSPLNDGDDGSYTCSITVSPDPADSAFNTMSAEMDTETLTVQALPAPNVAIETMGMSTAGQQYTLTCTVTVVENLVVQPVVGWSGGSTPSGVSNVMREGATSTLTLTFDPLRTSDGGQYTCTASISISVVSISNLNNAASSVIVLIPAPSVAISRDRSDNPLYAGTPLTLTCMAMVDTAVVDTAVSMEATWSGPGIGGSRVTASNFTLQFSPLDDGDDGSYTCSVTVSPDPADSAFNTMSGAGMDTETLTVQALPDPGIVITTEGSLTAGQQYTLTCTVTVVENLMVEPVVGWSGGSTPNGVSNVMREGATSTLTLTFDPLRTSDGGQYTCTASISISVVSISNLNNAASSVIVLIPAPSVAISRDRSDNPLYAGTPLTLTCMAMVDTAVVDTAVSMEATWSGPGIGGSRVTASNFTLQFSPLDDGDDGSYTCSVTVSPDPADSAFNTMSAEMDTETLTVQALPDPGIVITTEGNRTAGQQYTLTCTVTVVENLVVQPVVEWSPVSGEDITVGSVMQSGTVFTRALTFTTLHTSHGGEYTCLASITIAPITTDLSSEQKQSVRVQIPSPMVSVSRDPPNGPLRGGSSVTFTCDITLVINTAVDTDVTAVAMWTGPTRRDLTSSEANMMQEQIYQSTIMLNHLQTSDSGVYTCKAKVMPASSSESTFVVNNEQVSGTVEIVVELVISISIDYTPPPDAVLGPNEYRAATRLSITCEVQGATEPVTYTWSPETTLGGGVNDMTRQRLFLRSTHSGVLTCTATDSGGNSGTASIAVNVVGIGVQINVGDVNRDGVSDQTAALPNNGLVFSPVPSGNRNHFRILCFSESSQNNTGEIIGLGGSPVTTDPFTVTDNNPGGIEIRSTVDIDTDDQGVYTCRLPDSSGTQTLEANFGIYHSDFNTQLSITNLTYNSTTRTLTCISTGSPATTVTWRKNGVELDIDGSTYQLTQTVTNRSQATYENVLNISRNVQRIGNYNCSVSNILGQTSKDFNVTGVEITAPPQPLTVGEMATITCSTTLAVNKIEWRYNDQVVVHRGTPSRELNLTFNPVNETIHGRRYICRIMTSNTSQTEEEITVEVEALNTSIIIDGRGALTAGENYTLTCTVTGADSLNANISVMLKKDNHQVVKSGNGPFLTHLFYPLHQSDMGQYICEAIVRSPYLNRSQNLNETETITVTGPSVSVQITASSAGTPTVGDSYSLTCSVSGTNNLQPTITYEWRISNDISALNQVSTQTQSVFPLTPLALSDADRYTCEVTVSSPFLNSNITESYMTDLHVQIPSPTVSISQDSGMNTLTAGSIQMLTCNITLDPALETMLSGLTVVSDWSGPSIPNSRISQTGVMGSPPTTRFLLNTLTFNTLHTSDTGTYTCQTIVSPSSTSSFVDNGVDSETMDITVQNPTLTAVLEANTTRLPTHPDYNTFSLTCTATAAPTGVVTMKTFTWIRRELNGGGFTTLSDNGGSIQIETTNVDQPVSTSVLIVRETTAGQHTYRCRVNFTDSGIEPFNRSKTISDRRKDINISVGGPSNPLQVHNVTHIVLSFERVTIQWTVPQLAYTPETYVVEYGTDSSSLDLRSETRMSGDNFTAQNISFSLELRNLIPGTLYYYQLNSSNSHNSTLSMIRSFRTEEIPPGSVSTLDVMVVNNSSLNISWGVPEQPNGIITSYIIAVESLADGHSTNQTEMNTTLSITVGELSPGVPYKVVGVAVNSAGEGQSQCAETLFTQELTPSTGPNVTRVERNETHMEIMWEHLSLVEARGFITSYTISYQPSSGRSKRQQPMDHSVPQDQSSAVVGGLDPEQAYLVEVWANTSAGMGPSTNYTVLIYTVPAFSTPGGETNSAAGIAVGVVVGGLLLAAVCVILIMVAVWWLRRHGRLQFSDKPRHKSYWGGIVAESGDPGVAIELTAPEGPLEKPGEDEYLEDTTFLISQRLKAIPVKEFNNHVVYMHEDRDRRFEMEYRSIGKHPLASVAIAEIPHNKCRNRFGNIFPYDFNRVKLRELTGVEGSDYINASFLDGYTKKKAYIAAQGPAYNTITDSWRMIWEYRLPTIVMLTRCFEAGKEKCQKYWPGDGTITPGCNLSVTLTSVLPFAEYEMKKLVVKDPSKPEEPPLEVTHLHYLAWPDHGVPSNAMALITFIKRVRKLHPVTHEKPLLVHCSAGVGRTGTFIVLDSMLERMKVEGNVDIFNFLKKLRAQRVHMVQTESQYVFIHDALNQLINCGETEIAAANLRITANRLNKTVQGKQISGFQNQFELLEQVSQGKVKDADYSEAMASYNLVKNRYANKLPNDTTRVRLRPSAVHGSDYINASFIDGYRQSGAYIATQGPLQDTVKDFWRMMWEYQSKVIVMLCNLREDEAEVCHRYWPREQGSSEVYGRLKVVFRSERPHQDYIIRKLEISEDKPTLMPEERTVKLFQYTKWPRRSSPASISSLLEFTNSVTKEQMSTGNKAIVVMCNDGVGRTGTFISIHAQLERLKTEGLVDFFQFIKLARIHRAGMVQTVEQYMLCHDVLADYVDTFETYANFKDVV